MARKPKVDPAQQAAIDMAAAQQQEAERAYREGVLTLRDIIAPSSFTIENNYLIIGTRSCTICVWLPAYALYWLALANH
jgi:hypothetical protein